MTSAPDNPITTEIIRASLVSITDEMKTNLMRTAYNQIIYEAQDFTVGLFDASGDTISIGLGLPMFIRGLSDAIKAKLAFYESAALEPGDILLTNDAYLMGSHLNHLIFTMPVFHEGRVVAFAASMAHWIDIGGTLGGTTTDIYSEGLQIPIVKIFKAGVQDDELTRLIAMNVRFPDRALGDMRAQIAAVRTGESRFNALLEKYGPGVVSASIAGIFARSEALARAAVADMPDGEYEAESFMDDDGLTLGQRVPIRVRVVISGDQMTIDLSDVSPQVAGYYNSGSTAGRSAAQVAFKCLTSPTAFPINDGALRPLEIVLPPGTVVSAQKPAAMRWWMTYPMTVVDCILRALAAAVPGAAIAGHHADLLFTHTYGTDVRTGKFFMLYCGPHGGGWGATRHRDGRNATICINDGDTHNAPVEALEAKYPMTLVEEHSLRPDSGGAGLQRGGLGTRVVYRLQARARLNTYVERTQCPPWGLEGGGDGLPNRIAVRSKDKIVNFSSGKLDGWELEPGDAWIIDGGGGGGYGDALLRDPAQVLEDVRDGYVSRSAATEAYGVCFRADPAGSLAVDEVATASARHTK